MDAAGIRDWDEVRAFLVESYRLIAPRKCWEAYRAGGSGAAKRAGPKRARATRPAKRTARRPGR
jgi:hypothetical protein